MGKIYSAKLASLAMGLVSTISFTTPVAADYESRTLNSQRSETLIIGRVSDSPKKHYQSLKPMADYVAGKMSDLGIEQSRVLLAASKEEMIQLLEAGDVDWVTESLYSALVFEKQADAELLLRKWKNGVPSYHTVFFARRNSNISSLSDLAGRKISFEDPGSTTSFFLPSVALLNEGMDIAPLPTIRAQVAGNAVGYAFSKDSLNIISWVQVGIADAGAFSNLDWENDKNLSDDERNDLLIFRRTQDVPRALEIVRGDLDPKVKARLKTVLLTAADDPSAVDILKDYDKTSKFDEIDTEIKSALDTARTQLGSISAYVN